VNTASGTAEASTGYQPYRQANSTLSAPARSISCSWPPMSSMGAPDTSCTSPGTARAHRRSGRLRRIDPTVELDLFCPPAACGGTLLCREDASGRRAGQMWDGLRLVSVSRSHRVVPDHRSKETAGPPGRMMEFQNYRSIFTILRGGGGHQEPEGTWSRPFQTGWNLRMNPRDIPLPAQLPRGRRDDA
jgi:hypothetical protein